MEFVIVMPIYMLLLGFTFVTGELALQAIRLSSAADRICAMAPGSFDWYKRAVSPHDARDGANGGDWDTVATWQTDDTVMYSYEGDPAGGSQNTSKYDTQSNVVDRAWTRAVAARVENDYTLTPLTRGFVSFWYRENDRRVKEMGGNTTSDGVLDDVLGNGIGRIAGMVGKDLTDRKYGYYCLQRNEYGRKGYRTLDAGNLALNSTWKNRVAIDELAPSAFEAIEDAESDPPAQPAVIPVGEPQKQFPDIWTR